MHRVRLYSRGEGCPLCDDAKGVLLDVQRQLPFELEEVDVTTDPELSESYCDRIPLVWIDDRLAFKFYVDREELVERLGGMRSPNEG